MTDAQVPASQVRLLEWGGGTGQLARTTPESGLSDGPRSFTYDAANGDVVVVDSLNDRLVHVDLAGGPDRVVALPNEDHDPSDVVPTTVGGPLLTNSIRVVIDPTTQQRQFWMRIAATSADGVTSELLDGLLPFNTPVNLRLVYDPAADMLWADIGGTALYSVAAGVLSGTPRYIPAAITRPLLTMGARPSGFTLQYGDATVSVDSGGQVLNLFDISTSLDGRIWFLVGMDAPPGQSDVRFACLDVTSGEAQDTPVAWPPPIATFTRSMSLSDDSAVVYSGDESGAIFSEYPPSICPSV